jgi:hypothetical protein
MDPTTQYIHPEDKDNVNFWMKKFGVDKKELFDAILYTGTLDAKKVKEFLKRDSWLYHPVEGTTRILKNTINYIF